MWKMVMITKTDVEKDDEWKEYEVELEGSRVQIKEPSALVDSRPSKNKRGRNRALCTSWKE